MKTIPAAERRQTVDTAEGRGHGNPELNEPRSGERVFRRSAAHHAWPSDTTAFCRGYNLSPLGGWWKNL
jgi:hypothetical protein